MGDRPEPDPTRILTCDTSWLKPFVKSLLGVAYDVKCVLSFSLPHDQLIEGYGVKQCLALRRGV